MPTLENAVCYGCRSLIDERYYLMAVDRCWHLSCLKCFDCGLTLEQERTCFARHGQIFCKDDYIKRFCSRLCTRCHLNIRQDEVILRAKHFIFHLDCFTCVTCHQHLHPGDEFGLKDESIFCRQHFFEQQQQQQSYDPSAFLDESGYYTSPLPNPTTTTTTAVSQTPTPSVKRTRKRKDRCQTQTHDDLISSSSEHFLALSPSSSSNLAPDGALFAPALDSSYYVDLVEMESTSSTNNALHSHPHHHHHHHHHHARQKRVRTSFKHHQLRCMRSYFNLNHNPDAKDLKNLAEKTNLPKRVLQVWFQNARAKYRRSVSRSDTASQHSSLGPAAVASQSTGLSMPALLDIHSSRTEREDTTNSSNMSSPTESIHSKTSSMNFSESETCGSM